MRKLRNHCLLHQSFHHRGGDVVPLLTSYKSLAAAKTELFATAEILNSINAIRGIQVCMAWTDDRDQVLYYELRL